MSAVPPTGSLSLSPSFNRYTTNYSVSYEGTSNKVTVIAEPQSSFSTVQMKKDSTGSWVDANASGNEFTLTWPDVGEEYKTSLVEVKVTDQNSNSVTYKIYFERSVN